MNHTDPHPGKRGRLAVALLATAAGAVVLGGCSPSDGNENGFSLEGAASQIAAAIQQANDCGDVNPVLTAEQVTAALQDQFEASDGTLAFEAFVLQQVDLFDELANTACGISSDGNENENANDNQNDNG